ncbi:MAG TPA: PH domain-containing protein [Thermoanaerobaculia bacterium]
MIWVFSPFFLAGLVVLWSSSRRAVVSDAGIAFRSLFGSTFVPWSEIGHVRHSDSWVVIKDRDGHSHRIGPNPYKADDFERDVRDRRARGLTHAGVWNAVYDDPATRSAKNRSLTVLQGVAAVVVLILSLAFSIALEDWLPAIMERLVRFSKTSDAAPFILMFGMIQLVFLVLFLYAWASRSVPLWTVGKSWIFLTILLGTLCVLWGPLDSALENAGMSETWAVTAIVVATIAVLIVAAKAEKAFQITMPGRKRT